MKNGVAKNFSTTRTAFNYVRKNDIMSLELFIHIDFYAKTL